VSSPARHTVRGLCGYMLCNNRVAGHRSVWFVVGSVLIANLSDFVFFAWATAR